MYHIDKVFILWCGISTCMKQIQTSVVIKTPSKTILVETYSSTPLAVQALKDTIKVSKTLNLLEEMGRKNPDFKKILGDEYHYSIETSWKKEYEYDIADYITNKKKVEAPKVPEPEHAIHLADSPIAWEKHAVYRAIDKCFTCGLPLTHPLSIHHGVGPICGGFQNTKEYRNGLKGALSQRELDNISINWDVVHQKMENANYVALGINEGLSNPDVLSFVTKSRSGKAVLLKILGDKYWIPIKSVIYIKQTNSLYVQGWWLKDPKNAKLAMHKKMMSF
jgi:hypothetical protein